VEAVFYTAFELRGEDLPVFIILLLLKMFYYWSLMDSRCIFMAYGIFKDVADGLFSGKAGQSALFYLVWRTLGKYSRKIGNDVRSQLTMRAHASRTVKHVKRPMKSEMFSPRILQFFIYHPLIFLVFLGIFSRVFLQKLPPSRKNLKTHVTHTYPWVAEWGGGAWFHHLSLAKLACPGLLWVIFILQTLNLQLALV
jgi:hypothetical protein